MQKKNRVSVYSLSSDIGLAGDDIGCHVVERVLASISPQLRTTWLEEHLSPHLLDMALHSKANFVVQRLLQSASTAEEVEDSLLWHCIIL